MRRRPGAKLFHGRAVPGRVVPVEIQLASRADTPVDFVKLTLVGTEWAVPIVASGAANQRKILALEATHEGRVLGRGTHRLKSRFELPASAPPSYGSPAAGIRYDLHLHVSIPWWPDLHGVYAMQVQHPDAPPQAPAPALFATARSEHGDAIYVEASIASSVVRVGQPLVGQVAVSNLKGRKLRGLDLAFVQRERLLAPERGTREAGRFRCKVFDGTPPEGEPVRFSVMVPPGLSPSFSAGLFEIETVLELLAVVAWGNDVTLLHRLTVLPPGPDDARVADRGPMVAPVGKARRALLWAEAAARAGLENDAEHERMRGAHEDVKYTISLEVRDGAVHQVAELSWAPLGLDLEVRERRWTEAFGARLVHVEGAPDRLAVRARDAAQARAAVGAPLLGALASFAEASLDDAGARVSIPGAPGSVLDLARFVGAVQALAREAAAMGRRVPPPTGMEEALPAWTAVAEHLGGQLSVGRLAVVRGRVGAVEVAIETLWSRDGEPLGTGLVATIDPPIDDLDPSGPAFSPEARAALAALVEAEPTLELHAQRASVHLPRALPDPHDALPILERMVRLVRALRGVGPAGPFR